MGKAGISLPIIAANGLSAVFLHPAQRVIVCRLHAAAEQDALGTAHRSEAGDDVPHSGEKGLFILVAHSIAGIYVRRFVTRFPGDVAGLVFVDSSHRFKMAGRSILTAEAGNTIDVSAP
jgi:pimeloyl-ACP methyl ester carboxylesterase